MLRNALLTCAVLLAGCQSPVAAPHAVKVVGHLQLAKPLLAAIAPYAVADIKILTLKVYDITDPNNEVFVKDDGLSGVPVSADMVIELDGLQTDKLYKVQLAAYKSLSTALGEQISDDASSSTQLDTRPTNRVYTETFTNQPFKLGFVPKAVSLSAVQPLNLTATWTDMSATLTGSDTHTVTANSTGSYTGTVGVKFTSLHPGVTYTGTIEVSNGGATPHTFNVSFTTPTLTAVSDDVQTLTLQSF